MAIDYETADAKNFRSWLDATKGDIEETLQQWIEVNRNASDNPAIMSIKALSNDDVTEYALQIHIGVTCYETPVVLKTSNSEREYTDMEMEEHFEDYCEIIFDFFKEIGVKYNPSVTHLGNGAISRQVYLPVK